MMKRGLLVCALSFFGLMAGGCAAHAAYYSRVPPPAPRYEVYGYVPGPGYVWVNGYWRWGGGHYMWAPGYWARPPRRGAIWVEGRWSSGPRGYQWRDGYWR